MKKPSKHTDQPHLTRIFRTLIEKPAGYRVGRAALCAPGTSQRPAEDCGPCHPRGISHLGARLRGLHRFAFALLVLLAAAPPAAMAQPTPNPPERMSYQGFVTDGNGVALGTNAPKNYDIIFRIWNDQSATAVGNRMWAEQQTVTVDKGYFSVLLGEGSQYSSEPHTNLSSLFTGANVSDRYVEFTVKGIGSGGADVTVLPRLRLLTSPYSFLATKALSVDGTALTTGTVPNARLSANVALKAGGNTFTGTQTITGGNLGVGTTTPNLLLQVNGIVGARDTTVTDGYIDMQPGSAGYLEFFKPGPTRLGYLGYSSGGINNLGLNLEAGANFMINGGNVGIGLGTSSPTAQLDVTGQARVRGTIRTGSETGTSEAPNIAGLVVRRINSSSITAGQIVARDNEFALERDGTAGGLRLHYIGPGSVGGGVLIATGTTAAGVVVNASTLFYGGYTGYYQIFTASQKIIYCKITFGDPWFYQYTTEVTLIRFADTGGNDSPNWIGTVTSGYNQ